jgi:hypothetical protein
VLWDVNRRQNIDDELQRDRRVNEDYQDGLEERMHFGVDATYFEKYYIHIMLLWSADQETKH